jgi:hypothetical protein
MGCLVTVESLSRTIGTSDLAFSLLVRGVNRCRISSIEQVGAFSACLLSLAGLDWLSTQE